MQNATQAVVEPVEFTDAVLAEKARLAALPKESANDEVAAAPTEEWDAHDELWATLYENFSIDRLTCYRATDLIMEKFNVSLKAAQ